jgi:hypothetical protein
MKKLTIVLTLAIFITSLSSAQDYKNAAGIRLGTSIGGTIKHFVGERSAFEGLLTTRWQGLEITGLYEIHNNAFDVSRLNWFFGFGGHLGFYNGDHTTWGEEGTNYIIVGIDGIIGMDYSFEDVPINLSLDWKPMFNLTGYTGFWGDALALSVRYTF